MSTEIDNINPKNDINTLEKIADDLKTKSNILVSVSKYLNKSTEELKMSLSKGLLELDEYFDLLDQVNNFKYRIKNLLYNIKTSFNTVQLTKMENKKQALNVLKDKLPKVKFDIEIALVDCQNLIVKLEKLKQKLELKEFNVDDIYGDIVKLNDNNKFKILDVSILVSALSMKLIATTLCFFIIILIASYHGKYKEDEIKEEINKLINEIKTDLLIKLDCSKSELKELENFLQEINSSLETISDIIKQNNIGYEDIENIIKKLIADIDEAIKLIE